MGTGEPISPDLIKRLLQRGEGVELDYKGEQYKYDGADHEKAELLKDLLAFANADRANTAYILIGVGEDGEKVPFLKTCDEHPIPANLQQFVNTGKLNRQIDFHYTVVPMPTGERIGVISIPPQKRPTFLNQPFGKPPDKSQHRLLSNIVYYRRGDSTFIATPDDLYAWARLDFADDKPLPAFALTFADAIRQIPPVYLNRDEACHLRSGV